ncbi:MAG: SpaA isopeptide-forming pilin-related protein, partial [Chloroflexota bacterium]|nr:SpaA isopeptide-forming pilin-related protein [Chloroflexota bacterium]
APETGEIAITVVDGEDAAVGGACFDVTNDSGTFTFCDDDGDGRIDVPDVQFGPQTVSQTEAGDGYAIDPEPQSVEVTAEDPAAELTFRNDLDSAIVPVVAVDADGNALPSACWTLSGDGGEFGPLCDDGANGGTAEDGQVQFEGAPSGTYTLAQTQPPSGYGAVAEQEITVVAGDNEPVEVTHEVAPITVEVTTTDAEGGILAGACYAVDGGEPLCDSDGDAIVNLEDVAPGERMISQTTPPEGFAAAADQTTTVEIGLAPEVTFVNDTPLAGSVSATLVDEAGEPIIGACIAAGDAVAVCDNAPEDLDDADGAILTGDLDPGEYAVSVTDLPEGYDTPEPQTVTVTVDETTVVEFTVPATAPETGNLNVAVQTEGGDAVVNGCVALTRDGTVVAGPVCDNAEGDGDPAEGTVSLAEIETGTYTATLTPESTAAIEGFQSAGAPSVEIVAGETVEVVITVVIAVEPQAGTLQIVTRDNATNRRVSDACYQLTGSGDPIVACDGGSLDQNGTAGILQLADVPGGDYSLTMDTVPAGYSAAAEEGLTVEAGVVNVVEVRIDPLPEAGTLRISKVDGNGEPLGDSCFAVQQSGATIASVCDAVDAAPNDGIIEFADLAAGSYRLVETQVPSTAYASADPVAFEIVAGETTDLTVTNTPNPGRLVVSKVDAADASSRLPNACFILQGGREYGPFCDADDRTEDGRTVFANIVPGDYQLVETVPPAGYVIAGPRDVTIEPGSSQRVVVANEVAPPPEESGTLIVLKQDEARDALPGGCFRLFDGESTVTGRVCDNTDGTDDGTITFDDVPAGTWTLRETLAPSPSYQIADDREVTIANGETTEVSVVNTLKPGRVLVNKTNPEGQPLQDACFDLGSDGEEARCTDAAGVVVFSNLVPGLYVLTETSAPTGFETGEPVRDIAVQPGETAVLNLVNERTPPPANTGSVQIQKFYCPAGEAGERTQFLGGADGATQLSKTAGCDKGNAVFTLMAEDGSGGPGEFSTGDDGQYQVTVPEGLYTLTETDPDLAGGSSVRVRVFTGQLTTVIVLNDLAPPEPEPATINVAKYTCTPSFNGTLYEDFAQNCSSTELLTNDITIRAEGPVTARAVTGDGGKRGETSFTDLQSGRYTIYEERPYSIPTDYVFCGFDGDRPADYKAVNGRLEIEIDYGQTLTCQFFNIPEDLTETTGTILVRKYVCEVTDPPKGYDWENECRLSDQGSSFELSPYDPETEEYGDVTTAQANSDGLLRFTRLDPGEYRLREAEATWCHAESNSVNSRGDVVVRANALAEVWIYNCVDTDAPPNTGSGDAAGWMTPGGDGGNGGGMTVLLGIAWPVLAAGAWIGYR